MSLFQQIGANHNPNEGRTIINSNFAIMETVASSGSTGATIVTSGSNITISSGGTNPVFYQVSLNNNVVVNSLSATTLSGGTFFSGSTPLSTAITTLITGTTSVLQSGFSGWTASTGVNSLIANNGTNSASGVSASVLAGTGNTVGGRNSSIGAGGSLTNIFDDTFLAKNITGATISGATFFSGSTPLSQVMQLFAGGGTANPVQPGTNIYTGGSASNQTVNFSGGSIAGLTLSALTTVNSNLAISGQVYSNFVSLSSATITASTNCSLGMNFKITLTGNTVFENPTNMNDGGTYTWLIKQDTTGGWTLSYQSIFDWGLATAPTITSGASKVDIIVGMYDSSLSKLFMSYRQGFN